MRPIKILFLASICFSLGGALLAYVHSSMLGQFIPERTIGIAFTLSSVVALTLLFLAPRLERAFGAYKILVTTLGASLILLILLGSLHSVHSIWIFILYFSLNTTIWYNFNLLIEHFAIAKSMGTLRGLYLTLNNLAWVGAPLISGALIAMGGLQRPYLYAAIPVTLGLVLLLKHKKQLTETSSNRAEVHNLRQAVKLVLRNKPLRIIMSLTWALQLFYSIMALFMAPYLRHLGMSWGHIGIVLSIMLLPFVLFEFPVGKFLDKHRNEKGLLTFAFALMALAVTLLLTPLSISVGYFAAVLFMSRIGAAIVEVTTDSYFFRTIDESDVGLASLYQSALPLAYLVGPAIGGAILAFGGFHLVFTVLAAGTLNASLYAFEIKTE